MDYEEIARKLAEHIEIEYRRTGFCIMCLHRKHLSNCYVRQLHPDYYVSPFSVGISIDAEIGTNVREEMTRVFREIGR